MTQRTQKLSRRSFLLALGAGGAATAAAIVARSSGSKAMEKKDPSKRDARGYHASEHVNNYYRTAKV